MSSPSTDSAPNSTASLDHSHSSHHKLDYHKSHGTSNSSSEASKVSSVSIKIKETLDFFENVNTGTDGSDDSSVGSSIEMIS